MIGGDGELQLQQRRRRGFPHTVEKRLRARALYHRVPNGQHGAGKLAAHLAHPADHLPVLLSPFIGGVQEPEGPLGWRSENG